MTKWETLNVGPCSHTEGKRSAQGASQPQGQRLIQIRVKCIINDAALRQQTHFQLWKQKGKCVIPKMTYRENAGKCDTCSKSDLSSTTWTLKNSWNVKFIPTGLSYICIFFPSFLLQQEHVGFSVMAALVLSFVCQTSNHSEIKALQTSSAQPFGNDVDRFLSKHGPIWLKARWGSRCHCSVTNPSD